MSFPPIKIERFPSPLNERIIVEDESALDSTNQQEPSENSLQQARNDLLALVKRIHVFSCVVINRTEGKERVLFSTSLREIDGRVFYTDCDDKEMLERKAVQLQEAFIDALSDLHCIEQEKELLEEFNREVQRISLPSSTWDLEKIVTTAKNRIQVIGVLEDAPATLLDNGPLLGVSVTWFGKKVEKVSPLFCLYSNEFGGQKIRVLSSVINLMKMKEDQSYISSFGNIEVKIHWKQLLFSQMRFEEMFQHLITSANLGIMQLNPRNSLPVHKQYEVAQSSYKECRQSWSGDLENTRFPSMKLSIFQQPEQIPQPPGVLQRLYRPSAHPMAAAEGYHRLIAPIRATTQLVRPFIYQNYQRACGNEEGSPPKQPRLS